MINILAWQFIIILLFIGTISTAIVQESYKIFLASMLIFLLLFAPKVFFSGIKQINEQNHISEVTEDGIPFITLNGNFVNLSNELRRNVPAGTKILSYNSIDTYTKFFYGIKLKTQYEIVE